MSFEQDLFALTKKIKFQETICNFQNEIKRDIDKIKLSSKTLTPADKTSNMYKLSKETYNHLLQNSITKTYKKAKKHVNDKINEDGKKIAEKMNIHQFILQSWERIMVQLFHRCPWETFHLRFSMFQVMIKFGNSYTLRYTVA